ncbi:hypothetical protein [Corynebacterium sputi]|uniref:hypothetical protein n=1 Tax=Corynebacterium sputi TaxID=489915 RepID=UPI00041EF1DD|nr:hypothetical protein [Corynebacterium sputi]
MIFQSDNNRSSRASEAERKASELVRGVLAREEQVRNNIASEYVDPWEMRYIIDETITRGPIADWRHEAVRASRLIRRYSIQSGYREKLRDVEKRIDAILLMAESLEESWDAAAASSKRLSDAEARDADAFERERRTQNDAEEARRIRDEKREQRRRDFQRKVENIASDTIDRTREVGGGVLRRSIDVGRDALDKMPSLRDLPRKGDDHPREVRKAEARDLRKEPPLPED